MPKSEREDTLSALSSRLFAAMLSEIVLDTTLQSHQEIARSRAICDVCHTRCGLVHIPGPSNVALLRGTSDAPASRPQSPGPDEKVAARLDETTGDAPTIIKSDGVIYYDCLNCKRKISSNRYATHLSSCMGLGNGTRKAAVRNATAKPSDRSASPYIGSDDGSISEETSKTKGKSKGGEKKRSAAAADLETNGIHPPLGLQQASSTKKKKKTKTGVSPIPRQAKGNADGDQFSTPPNSQHLSPFGSQSKIPSKLRASSTASFHDRVSSPDSSASSPGTPIASLSTPSSSSRSIQSPILNMARRKDGNATSNTDSVFPSIMSRRSPPPPQALADPDYVIDVDGDDTTSSSDSDST